MPKSKTKSRKRAFESPERYEKKCTYSELEVEMDDVGTNSNTKMQADSVLINYQPFCSNNNKHSVMGLSYFSLM